MASTAMFAPYDPASAMARRIVAPITGNAYQIDPRGSALVDSSDVAWFQTQGFSATPTASAGQSLMYAPYMADEGMTGPTTNPNTGNTYFINAAGAVAVATADIAWFQTQGYALVPTPGTGFSLMSTQIEVAQALAGPIFSPITGNMYVMNGQGWIIAATADVAWLQGQGFAPVVSGGVAPPIFPPTVSGTNATIAADFAGQQYWASAASQASFAAWLTAIGGTYTRASSATYLQGGVVKTAAANTPRFPTDLGGVPQGIRLTGAGTNLATQSQTFTGVGWQVQGATLTNNTGPAPDGTNTASTLAITTNTGNNLAFSFSGTTSQPYIGSFWVKGTPGQQVFFSADTNGPPAGAVLVTFNGSWQLVSGNATGTALQQFLALEIFNRSGGAALPNVTFNIWGAQLTQSAFLLDYIPTTTVTVTQAADSFSFPFTQTTFSALVGTNSLNFIVNGRIVSSFPQNAAYVLTGDATHFGTFIPGNGIFLTGPAIAGVINPNKTMMAANPTSVWITSNGLAPVTGTSTASSDVPISLSLALETFGNFSQIAVWNALVASTAEMQRLTT